MTMLEKIVFIADYIEPSRNFEGLENIRKLAFRDIDLAVFEALENSIKHLIDKKSFNDSISYNLCTNISNSMILDISSIINYLANV